ncbi:MAG: hypothetical protein DCC49_06565 [Acidobacteria bacterium]|nr:MAG: hypothetical protein DCC49_06565 [Acidobacteriota bacterium]
MNQDLDSSSTSGFRLDFNTCLTTLRQRLGEPAPGRIQLLTGPRQVGKTTLLIELASELGKAATYVAADGPEATIPGFWERIWSRARSDTASGRRHVVLIDEIQSIENWATKLKSEWDDIRRREVPVHVVATGSSALRLRSGSRESLAGRFERLSIAHWSPLAIAGAFELPENEAANLAVRIGTYPGAMEFKDDLARWAAYIRDAIIEPAITRDVLAISDVRRPALLRQVFSLAAASPTTIISLQKLQGALQDRGALETIAHYLELLEDAYLIAALKKHSARQNRTRAAPPKFVVLNNALASVVDPRGAPDASTDPQRFGAWVENACLARAWNAGQQVAYWRNEPFEVDAVIDGSWGSWVIEVKTGRFGGTDLRGIGEFTRLFPDYRPLIICDDAQVQEARRFGFAARSWREFLLNGPPEQSA